jgi:hypothetical protein
VIAVQGRVQVGREANATSAAVHAHAAGEREGLGAEPLPVVRRPAGLAVPGRPPAVGLPLVLLAAAGLLETAGAAALAAEEEDRAQPSGSGCTTSSPPESG